MTRNNMLRGWWKPWKWSTRTWIIAIVLSVVALPFVTRWVCLSQIPDVAVAFDVEDVIEDEVPDDQNAYWFYARVLELLANPTTETAEKPNTEIVTANHAARLSDRLMAHNELALAEYIRAGKMERSAGPPLKTTTLWTSLNLQQDLRRLVRTYNGLGVTFEDCGEIEKAWDCHRANLQCSIHAEQTPQAISALIAISIRSMSAEGIVHWASNPTITADRLRAARTEVADQYARRAPYNVFARGEYVILRNSMNELDVVDEQLPTSSSGASSPMPIQIGKRALLWCFAQPELALRINRQILVNNAAELDKPLYERRGSAQRSLVFIFDLDPNVQKVQGQLSAEQLIRTLESESPALRLNKALLLSMVQFDSALRRDDARLAILTVLFAAHEHQRTHGEYPDSVEQLVPSPLSEVPRDPMEPAGKPINYRREPDGTALVWSVGLNGTNDQGDISSSNYLDTGYQIKLNRSDAAEPTKLGPKRGPER